MFPIDKARESRFDALHGSSNLGRIEKHSPTPRNETRLVVLHPTLRPGERRSSFTLGIGEKLVGFGLEDGDARAEGHVVAIFSPLFGSEQSLIAAPGQVIHTGLQFGICFQGQEPPGRLRGQALAKGANKPFESWSSIRRFHAEIIPLRWQGAKGTCGTETATYSAYRLLIGGAI